MAAMPTRQWFQPGEGIAREVITADIQRYLGPDALVRPGEGTGEYEVCLSIRTADQLEDRLLTDNRVCKVIGSPPIAPSHRYVCFCLDATFFARASPTDVS